MTSMLCPLDKIHPNDSTQKCISNAHHFIGVTRSSIIKDSPDKIVPNSGATSHMRHNRADFEDDYVTCNDIFVLIGDGTTIPVLGYGPSEMKINVHITRFINILHVPGLDCDLFSCT